MKSEPTIWDKIYRERLGTGKKFATIGGELHPMFVDFVESHTFKKKSALDICCGEGRYLKYLKDRGFAVAGIDSSAKAIEVTRKLVGQTKDIEVADMYHYAIEPGKFGFIMSIAAMQHGPKKDIADLIVRIQRALAPGGRIFITLSELYSGAARHSPFKEIAPGVFYSPSRSGERLNAQFFHEGRSGQNG